MNYRWFRWQFDLHTFLTLPVRVCVRQLALCRKGKRDIGGGGGVITEIISWRAHCLTETARLV